MNDDYDTLVVLYVDVCSGADQGRFDFKTFSWLGGPGRSHFLDFICVFVFLGPLHYYVTPKFS